VKVSYRQAARDDLIRQFRYYLVVQDRPDVAVRFREAVRRTVAALRARPLVGARYQSDNPRLVNLRSWPVENFEANRIYYLLESDVLEVIRILHGSRDIQRILTGNQEK